MIYFQCNKGRIHIEKTCQLLILHFEHLETEKDIWLFATGFIFILVLIFNILQYSLIFFDILWYLNIISLIFSSWQWSLKKLPWQCWLGGQPSPVIYQSPRNGANVIIIRIITIMSSSSALLLFNVIIICFITISRGGDVQGTNVRGSLYPGVYAVFVI